MLRGGKEYVLRERTSGLADYYISKPVIETFWCGVNSCMRTIDRDSFLGETQEGVLLGVGQGEGFQGLEDDGILTYC
jgi:hypothetical protein